MDMVFHKYLPRQIAIVFLVLAAVTSGTAYAFSSWSNATKESVIHTANVKLNSAAIMPPSDVSGSTLGTVYAQVVASLPSQASLYSSYQDSHVSLVINGTSVSNLSLATETQALEQDAASSEVLGSSGSSSGPPSPTGIASIINNLSSISVQNQFLDQSLAANALDQLLFAYAQNNGLVPSIALVTQVAAQNYANWLNAGSPAIPATPGYPPNANPSDLMESPQAINTIQFAMAVNAATSAIAGPPDPSGSTSRTSALAAWMSTQLPTSKIAISIIGALVPSLDSLPGLLPKYL